MDLDDAVEAQLGLQPADAVAQVMADMPAAAREDIPRVQDATPEQRYELARAHEVLERVEKAVKARRQAIELAFLRAAAEMGSDQLKLAGGTARVTQRASKYEAKGHEMREQLLKLKDEQGNITQEEIDEALALIISVKPNHSKLNYLARHRGEAVAQAIEDNRKKVEPDPMTAKVEFGFEGGAR